MTKIKLCGMMQECDIDTVNTLHPDHIGFIFWEKSKRNLTEEQARTLKNKLDPAITAVGVFVDEAVEKVAGLLKSGIIDIAQLHGHEDESYIAALRSMVEKPVFRAFRIRSEEDVKQAAQSSADAILVDAGTGCGKTFDWSLLKSLDRPFYLAGGLGLENIQEALETVQPYGVDVSSGIETEGKKDPEKMREFVRIVREYDGKKEQHE